MSDLQSLWIASLFTTSLLLTLELRYNIPPLVVVALLMTTIIIEYLVECFVLVCWPGD